MRFPLALPLAVLLVLPLGACKKKPLPKPLTDSGAAAPAASSQLPNLVKKYGAMSDVQRLQAARGGCYVPDKCNALEAKALFQAAPAAEKDSLKAAARPVFAEQYDKALIAKGKKPDSVAATGQNGTTLEVKGPPCNRFLIENFMGDFGDSARMLGFKHVACENKAMKAKADL